MAGREIDRELDTPIYEQIAAFIRSDIQSGKLQPRRPVPSVRALTEEFDVARETASQALHVLEDEGLVRRVPGKGFFVTQRS